MDGSRSKSINTLVRDIQKLVTRKDGWFDERLSTHFADSVARRIKAQYAEKERAPTLRLSKMGPCCPKALWYSIHHPELAEPLPPWAEVKFSFGHIIEALALCLVKASGHRVEGEQDEVLADGITGHRDAIVDGCIVDFKSCSSIAFKKFKDKSIVQNDSFGYLDQLDGYLLGSLNDPLVQVKDKAYILAIDKTLGHMVLYEHRFREANIRQRIEDYKRIVTRSSAPTCTCKSEPDGKSGNIKLSTVASYSSYKFCCFPGLRTFLYSNGPRYLTNVERLPDVPEINQHGQIIH